MISSDQKEILGELINIAFGAATSLIADLFDNFATLRIPLIDVISIDEVNQVAKEGVDSDKFYTTTQQIKGSFQGEIVLVVGEKSARNMQLVIGEDENSDETSLLQNILEIANILGSSCMGKLVELLDSEIGFSPPSIRHTDLVVQNISESPYTQVIIISTVLEFKELNIKANMVIMFGDEMYIKLCEALDNFLENI
ncbi:chemotaxis protein CheX [Desulfopila sp. IMCC35008]|uniref:chemotaxis protein CheX n=1 Tax=Desulfopila sp. IMCC35008 TaxID=2653858 RepID=UPI0013D1D084|nr:chemotaxis protein CheX [Desulfopila sp. IMCC35008]